MDPSGQFVVPQVRKQYLNQTEKYIFPFLFTDAQEW